MFTYSIQMYVRIHIDMHIHGYDNHSPIDLNWL